MMVDTHTLLAFLTLLSGFYMAWNIGANDVANAMGTSVGSKALTLKKAVFLAAILEFSGAFFVGSSVSETIQHGIIDPTLFTAAPLDFVYGMLGALLATGILLQVASYFGLPISTTHAIVGAVLGFGVVAGGPEAVHWHVVWEIAASWVLSPFLSAIVSYAIFNVIQRKIFYALDPLEASRRIAPLFVFLCFALLSWSLLYDGLMDLHLNLTLSSSILLACGVGSIASFVSTRFLQRSPQIALRSGSDFLPEQAVGLEKALHHLQRVYLSNSNSAIREKVAAALGHVKDLTAQAKKSAPFTSSTTQYQSVEKIFVSLQIMSACLVAFAHGANDVANAIGPVNAVLTVLKNNTIQAHTAVPTWLLALGGAGIVIGLATWGWRVIETIGSKITELTPTRGFSAEFGAAATILAASKLGLPISTTHALVGAVFGVGMARGLQALNLKTLLDILVSWLVTIPLCALFSIAIFTFLRWIF